MAKRNQKKFVSKQRKSALRVEALEQRQLLAAVTGDGTEVGSNITVTSHGVTHVYDQVLMTGSSVTVSNDPGQTTRVSFLDLQGDIVQAEFSGAGSLTITMDPTGFQTGVSPTNYNQPGVKYVEGLASFTIQGEDATTNFAVFSVGKANAVNQALFDDTHTGGDHWADVQRLTIVADPSNPNGSTFGAIFAGNAIFEGSSGTVGIAAANVNVQNGVTIGDIIATDSATPTLVFGAASQFSSVQVAGGGLLSPNGTPINDLPGSQILSPYIYGINFVTGSGSDGTLIPAQVLNPAVTFASGAAHNVTTLDTSTNIDITGLDQAQLDALFLDRTFTNNLTIDGDLGVGFHIDAAAFKGTVTFTGNVAGDIYLQDINNSNLPIASFGGDVTFEGDLSGHVVAEGFHNVTVDGDFSGHIDSTVIGDSGNPLPGGLGNVTIMGNDSGTVWSDWNIGNIYVGGDLTSGATAFTTDNNVLPATHLGNIGTLTVVGDVDTGGTLLSIVGTGMFGNVVIEGHGSLAAWNIGAFDVANLAAGQTGVGSFTITDAVVPAAGASITFDGVDIASNAGSVGVISITGGNTTANGSTFTLPDGELNAGSFGNITVSGFSNITIGGDITAHTGAIGNITLSTVAGTADHASAITIYGDIYAYTSIGNISADAGAVYSSVSLSGNIGAEKNIASLYFNGLDVSVGNVNVEAGGSLGNVTLNAYGDLTTHGGFYGDVSVGNVTFTAAAGTLSAHGEIGSYGAVGDVALTAGGDIWTGTDIYGASIHSLTVNAGGNINSWSHIGNYTDAEVPMHSAVGAVSFTATGDVTLHSASWIHADTIAGVTVDAGGNAYVDGNIQSATSTGDVTVTAGDNLEFSGDLGGLADAHTHIGNVTLTAGEGSLTMSGDIGDSHTAVLGNVSLTAHGYVYSDSNTKVVTYGGGDVSVSGQIYATDSVGNVTLTAESGGSVHFDGVIAAGAVGNVTFNADTAVWNYAGSDIVKSGNVWSHGYIGEEGTNSIASITFDAYDNIATHTDSNIYAADSIGNVTFTTDATYGGSIWLHGNITSDGTLGAVSVTAGDNIVVHGDIYATDSIASVSITAANNLTISGNIYAGDNEDSAVSTIGDVSFEATNGSLTDSGWLHANTSIGNVSFTAHGNLNVSGNIGADYYNSDTYLWVGGTLGTVSFTSTHGNTDVSAYAYAATIGDVTFSAANGSNDFSGGIGWHGDYHTALSNVTFTAGTSNTVTGYFYADAAGSFTFTGDTTMTATDYSNIHVESADVIVFNNAATLTNDGNTNIVIGWEGADSEGLLHGLSFNGTTTLNGTVLDSTLANIDGGGDANGIALHFTDLTTNGDTLLTHTVGDAVFDGNTVFTGGTFWTANDHTSALDKIGNLTFNGTVTGVAGTTDIQASSIGNITITAALDLSNKTLVTDFNVFAGNNTGTLTNPGEALSSSTDVFASNAYNPAFADGANIGDFKIGNITVQDTQTIGFSGTTLFGGTNGLNAIGGIGNVKLLGGGTATKQDGLFADGSSSLVITAGVFGSADNAIALNTTGGFDFDGIGGIGTVVNPGQTALPNNLPPIAGIDPFLDSNTTTGTDGASETAHGGLISGTEANAVGTAVNAELNATFSDAVTVSIGNIEVSAASDPTTGAGPDTIQHASGLHIASGVNSLYNGAETLTNVSGSIGNIFVHNSSQALGIYNAAGNDATTDGINNTPPGAFNTPGTFVAHSVGTLQSFNAAMVAGDYAILGNDLNHNAGDADATEFVVIVV